jgi:hypothetical protein
MAEHDFLALVGPHMTYLHDNLDLGWRLVNALCDVGLLTWENRGDVMDQREPRSQRIDRLLNEILPYTGPYAGNKFIEALQISQQHHVVKKLREPRPAGSQGGSRKGRGTQNQTPLTEEFLQKQLDCDAIIYIGPHIGRWKPLGRCLGFTEGQMENIEEDHFKNQEEQGVQMLHKWVKRESVDATLAKLVAAAQKAQKGDLVHLIREYAKTQT